MVLGMINLIRILGLILEGSRLLISKQSHRTANGPMASQISGILRLAVQVRDGEVVISGQRLVVTVGLGTQADPALEGLAPLPPGITLSRPSTLVDDH